MKSLEERDLQEFLAKLPAWKQKAVRDDINSMSHEDLKAFGEYIATDREGSLLALNQEYQRLARKVPKEWNRYCKIERQHVLQQANAPKPVIGRPRKDSLAAEAQTLKAEGMSYKRIAVKLNHKYGAGTTNGAAIRQLLKDRRTPKPPEKSHT